MCGRSVRARPMTKSRYPGVGPEFIEALRRLGPARRLALHRVVKTRAAVFFRNPYSVICLRDMVEKDKSQARNHARPE